MQRTEKSPKSLCYFCDQPYGRGHRCQTKMIQLFLVKTTRDTNKGDEELENTGLDNKLIGFEMLEISQCISAYNE